MLVELEAELLIGLTVSAMLEDVLDVVEKVVNDVVVLDDRSCDTTGAAHS